MQCFINTLYDLDLLPGIRLSSFTHMGYTTLKTSRKVVWTTRLYVCLSVRLSVRRSVLLSLFP